MLCVIAKLDEDAAERLRAMQRAALSDVAVWKPLYGHITVATYIGECEAAFIRSCRAMLADVSAFTARYERIAVLEETSTLAAIARSAALEAMQRRIEAVHGDSLNQWTRADRFLPHTTLYYAPGADLSTRRSALDALFTPFTARISRIEFSRVYETGYQIVDRVALRP